MDKLIVVLVVLFDSLVLITSSSLQVKPLSKEELQSLIELTQRPELINSQELALLYDLFVIHLKSRYEKSKTSMSPQESAKRKYDEYGHLRFGRNNADMESTDGLQVPPIILRIRFG